MDKATTAGARNLRSPFTDRTVLCGCSGARAPLKAVDEALGRQGHGDPWALAVTVRDALTQSATPVATVPSSVASSLDLDTASLDQVMGRKGKQAGAVYQYVVLRAEKLTGSGMAVPGTMGTGTVLNFQPLGGGRAVITGDFVLTVNEVDLVMRGLRAADIEVNTLQNHMLNDEPRLFFMHFWGAGDAAALARGSSSAVQQTPSK